MKVAVVREVFSEALWSWFEGCGLERLSSGEGVKQLLTDFLTAVNSLSVRESPSLQQLSSLLLR